MKFNGLIAICAALIWVAVVVAHNILLPVMAHSPGIDVVFIPSGVRLVLLMVGGPWAAVGVALGSLFLIGPEFGTGSPSEIAVIALCTGFCPYLALLATQRLFGISANLGNLKAVHLPIIALGVGIGSSLLHNLLFLALGRTQLPRFPGDVMGMVAGDFTGSLLAVGLLCLVVRLRRAAGA